MGNTEPIFLHGNSERELRRQCPLELGMRSPVYATNCIVTLRKLYCLASEGVVDFVMYSLLSREEERKYKAVEPNGDGNLKSTLKRNPLTSLEAAGIVLTCWILLLSWLCLSRLSSSPGSPASWQKEYKATESLQLDRRLLRIWRAGRMREAPSSTPFRIWVSRGKEMATLSQVKGESDWQRGPNVLLPFFVSLKPRGGEQKNRNRVTREEEYRWSGHLTYKSHDQGGGDLPSGCVRPSAIAVCSPPSPALHLINKTHTHTHF